VTFSSLSSQNARRVVFSVLDNISRQATLSERKENTYYDFHDSIKKLYEYHIHGKS
jgi:hypothetical protein